jgi:DNA-binding transcriptional ArsR family regulator
MRSLDVLAEPTRRRILDLLCTRDHSVNEIAGQLAIGQPSASKHLKVLRDAGLVTVRPDAQRRVYCLRAEPLRELDEWLTPYRRFWAGRLDALERHLDVIDPPPSTSATTDTSTDSPATEDRS